MQIQKLIEDRLSASFPITYMDVANESHKHNVPPNSETHFKVVLVSPDFNELHKVARSDAVLLVVDVDMEVKYPFFLHAEMYAKAGISVYFPIVWSRFSPASIKLVEKFRGARVGRLSDYEGMWRPYGYGNYAIHGSDALELQMDEDIVGWGGEDNDFHKRCSALRHTVRMHDPAIVSLKVG